MKKKLQSKKNAVIKVPLSEKVTDNLDIPKETVYDVPYITLIGDKEVKVENFINIITYGEYGISLKTQCGILSIEGQEIVARHMDSESIVIRGNIKNIGFTR